MDYLSGYNWKTFYNWLNSSTKTLVDAVAGDSLMAKTHKTAYDLLEQMVANAY